MTTQTNAQANITPAQADAMLAAETAAPAAVAAPESANDNAVDAAAEIAPQAMADDAARTQLPPVEEARAPVKGPEEGVIAPTPEAIVPPPHGEVPKPPVHSDAIVMAPSEREAMQQAIANPQETTKLIVFPDVLKRAEQNLANYIGSKISSELTQELNLDVKIKTGDDKTGKTKSDVVLYLKGDLVDANSALIETQVLKALQSIPSVAPFFNTEHKPHASNAGDYSNTLHLTIPNLYVAQYAHLIQALASGVEQQQTNEVQSQIPAPAHADAAAEHQCSGAGCSHCNVQGVEAQAKVDVVPPPQSATAEMHPAAEVAAVAQASAAQAVGVPPATQVANVAHKGVANNNEIAPNQTAVGL